MPKQVNRPNSCKIGAAKESISHAISVKFNSPQKYIHDNNRQYTPTHIPETYLIFRVNNRYKTNVYNGPIVKSIVGLHNLVQYTQYS